MLKRFELKKLFVNLIPLYYAIMIYFTIGQLIYYFIVDTNLTNVSIFKAIPILVEKMNNHSVISTICFLFGIGIMYFIFYELNSELDDVYKKYSDTLFLIITPIMLLLFFDIIDVIFKIISFLSSFGLSYIIVHLSIMSGIYYLINKKDKNLKWNVLCSFTDYIFIFSAFFFAMRIIAQMLESDKYTTILYFLFNHKLRTIICMYVTFLLILLFSNAQIDDKGNIIPSKYPNKKYSKKEIEDIKFSSKIKAIFSMILFLIIDICELKIWRIIGDKLKEMFNNLYDWVNSFKFIPWIMGTICIIIIIIAFISSIKKEGK